ncbi:MAG: C2H2-type zinc finger protein [Thermodesulfobacteriota bacterium]
MTYRCPICNKVSKTSMDLVRHMMGRGDSVHRDWINAKGFNYAEMLASQFQSFGSEEYKRLALVLENEPGVKVEG